jgi:cytochrome c1
MAMPNMSAVYRKSPVLYAVALTAVAAAVWFGVAKWKSQSQRIEIGRALTQGDPAHAPVIMRRYGCTGCHTIPGIVGADGQVGGSLADISKRVYVGGVINNSAENLVRWIVSPQSFLANSAMPATGISEDEARDVVAYLYSR